MKFPYNHEEEIAENKLNDEQKANVIRSTWVVVMKQLLGETVCKAKICARGDMEIIEVKTPQQFQNFLLGYSCQFSP